MLSWKEEYYTGIELVDKQHQELFSLSNELCRAIEHNVDIDLNFIITRLELYSMYHFTTEEQLMLKHGYDGFKEHKEEHEMFRDKIVKLKEKFVANESSQTAEEMRNFIEEWLQSHTVELDQKFVSCLKDDQV